LPLSPTAFRAALMRLVRVGRERSPCHTEHVFLPNARPVRGPDRQARTNHVADQHECFIAENDAAELGDRTGVPRPYGLDATAIHGSMNGIMQRQRSTCLA
jgi:hypothetical protein